MYHGIAANFYALLQQRLAQTKATAFFTSDVNSDFSWSGGAGKAYRALNLKRAAEGVRITRVFIVESLEDLVGDVLDLVTEQAATANMNIRIALAANLGRDTLYDMGIYDEQYFSYFELTPNKHEIRGHRTFNTSEQLTHAFDLRARLIENSEDARVLLGLP